MSRATARAVDHGGALVEVSQALVRLNDGTAPGDLLDDLRQELEGENAGGLGETPEAEAREFEPLAQRNDVAGLLQTAHAVNDRREEVDQKPAAELIVVEFAFGVGAVIMQRGEQINDTPEKFAARHIAGRYLRFWFPAAGWWLFPAHGKNHARARKNNCENRG
jgi:hypothetical protein